MVEGVDIEQVAEEDSAVLVESEQGSEAVGIELGEADYAAGLIAGHAGVAVFGVGSESQGFGLGDGVGEELAMHVAAGEFLLGAARANDELARDKPTALVQELVVGVLAVGAFAAEDDHAARVGQGLVVGVDAFAEAFHAQLLIVVAEAAEAVAVNQ